MSSVPTVPLATVSGAFQAQPLNIDLFESDAQVVAARTIIMYGESGLGKSTNARFFAQYLYELTGKPVRLLTCEDSSKTIFQPLIDTGIVDPLFVTKSKNVLVILRRIAKGEWPLFNADGTVTWLPMKDWSRFSGFIGEGLASLGESLLEESRAQGRFLREQKSDAFTLNGETFALASQTSYNFVQMELVAAMKGIGMLPIERALWTTHEAKGVDEDNKPLRGPGLVGTAATNRVQKYCGLLLHMDGVAQPDKTQKPRIYYKRHADLSLPNIYYPAKTTIPPEAVAILEKEFPGGYFEPGLRYGEGLDKFLKVEAKLVAQTTDDIAKWKASLKK